jgi:hypothetical protein
MKIKFLFIISFLFISCATEDVEVQLDAVVDGKYKTNVLIEDYTGAWCGYCPRIAKKIEDLWSSTSQRITPIAIHNRDAFSFAKEGDMRTKFWVASMGSVNWGFPSAIIDRSAKWNEQLSVVTDRIAIPSTVGIALESSIKTRTLTLKAKVGFGADLSDLKLVVYLTENGLKADQANYDDFGYGTANPLVDFVHDNVLRASLSDVFGDAIDSSLSKNGEIFEKTYEYVIPDDYSILSNLVVFVVDKDDKVLNSRFFVTTGQASANGKFQTVD